MRLRGRRTFSLLCLVVLIIILIVILVVACLTSIVHTILTYHYFVHTYPFPTVPFWKDNRTVYKAAPLPVRTIGDVNLSDATLVITSCCRNVEKHLIQYQRNVRAIGALFSNYRLYLGESDSTDQTLTLLLEWAKNDSNHVHVHTEGQQRWRMFSRTNRIAQCRNTLLQYAHHDFPSFDYYLVIDVDVGASSEFNTSSFLSNFIYPSASWAVMTATQKAEYYDIWALRVRPSLAFDCWQRIRSLTSFYLDQSTLVERLIQIHQKPIPPEQPLIEVESAFGGAAVYVARYLNEKCVYSGSNDQGWWWWWNYEQCEHVSFHQCIQRYAEAARIFINPKFQIC